MTKIPKLVTVVGMKYIRILFCCLPLCLSQSISIFAGTNVNNNGQGLSARFSSPASVTADLNGNIYIADYSSGLIRKINATNYVTCLAGTGWGWEDGPAATSSFNQPSGIAIDSLGNLFVADSGNNVIRKIDTNGYVSTFAGDGSASFQDGISSSASFNTPTSIFIDHQNNLFVSDNQNNRIRKISPSGVVSTIAGNGKSNARNGQGTLASLYKPYGIIGDALGNLYVTEYGSNLIRKINSTGFVNVLAGSGLWGSSDGQGTNASFNNPTGITIDSSNTLYVADSGNNVIRRISVSGTVSTLAGIGTSGSQYGQDLSATFNFPTGVAVDKFGNLIVSDQNNRAIRLVNPNGGVSTLAGSNYSIFSDGQGTNAAFQIPWGLAVDISGNVFVADCNNHVVRKINSTGFVTSLGYSYSCPQGIAVDAHGNLYVTDSITNEIKFNDARLVTLNNPNGILIDNSGNLIVCNTASNTILKIDGTGYATTIAGNGKAGLNDGQGTASSFSGPEDITIDGIGNIFVADTENCCIRKINISGYVSTVAGTGSCDLIEGQGISAAFDTPYGLAIDSFGNILVADTYNNRIRMINLTGYVSTIAIISNPVGIRVDFSGNIFVSSQGDNVIYVFKEINGTSSVAYTTTATSTAGSSSSINRSNSPASSTLSRQIILTTIFTNAYSSSYSAATSQTSFSPSTATSNQLLKSLSKESYSFTSGSTLSPSSNSISTSYNTSLRITAASTVLSTTGTSSLNVPIPTAKCTSLSKRSELTLLQDSSTSSSSIVKTTSLISPSSFTLAASFHGFTSKQTPKLKRLDTEVMVISIGGSVAALLLIISIYIYVSSRKSEEPQKDNSIAFSGKNLLESNMKSTEPKIDNTLQENIQLTINMKSIYPEKNNPSSAKNNSTGTWSVSNFIETNQNSITFEAMAEMIEMAVDSQRTMRATGLALALPGYLKLDYHSDLIFGENAVGSGGTATISEAELLNQDAIMRNKGSSKVAVKIYDKSFGLHEKDYLDEFRFEVAIMGAVNHISKVVKLIGYTENPESVVMRCYPTNLANLIFQDIILPPEFSLKVAHDISYGMEGKLIDFHKTSAIHSLGIVHFDLKPNNILVEVRNDQSFDCVICDFGFASVVGSSHRKEVKLVRGMDAPRFGGHTTQYAAPEMFLYESNRRDASTEDDKKIDVYAYGIVLYETMTQSLCWSDYYDEDIERLVTAGDRPQMSPTCRSKFRNWNVLINIVESAWSQNRNNRPYFHDINALIREFIKLRRQNTKAK